MRILVTGSFGHLGEALIRTLRHLNHEVIGVDLVESPFTTRVGSITDRVFVRSCMPGVQVVFLVEQLKAGKRHAQPIGSPGRIKKLSR